MLKEAREVFFFDIKLRSWSRAYPNGLNALPHFELAEALKDAFVSGHAEYSYRQLQYIYISDIVVRPDRCEILLGFSDTTAADPTLNDRPKKKRRVVLKLGDEGVEHSAHIVWQYGDKKNNTKCAFLLEHATHLASGATARFLNRVLRGYAHQNKTFKLPDPSGHKTNGQPTMVDVRPSFELLGHPSKEFLNDLKKGQMTELELYTEESAAKPWDANAYAIEKRRGVTLKPNDLKLLPKAAAFLGGVLTKDTRNQYERARVAFKTESNVARAVNIFTENMTLVTDNGYVRKERIDLSQYAGLPNAFDQIHDPIIKKMRALLP